MQAFQLLTNSTSPISARPKSKHLGVLDFLRGFAALSVVLYHFTGGPPMLNHATGGLLAKYFSPSLQALFSWGNMGVEVFFVISGFVIPYSLWNIDYNTTLFGSYIKKRILRILPPAYINIILILVQWFIIDHIIHHNNNTINSLSTEILIKNFLFLYKFANPHWINGVFWTLSIEFQFYIIIGLLFNIIFKANIYNVLIVYSILSLVNFIPDFPNYTFFQYSPLFAMGSITLLHYKERINIRQFFAMISIFFIISCFSINLLASIFGITTTQIIAFVKTDNKVFNFFGKISFSLYLTHGLVGSTLEFLLSRIFPPKTEIDNIIGIIIITAMACLFAYLYFLLVENPLLDLVNRNKVKRKQLSRKISSHS